MIIPQKFVSCALNSFSGHYGSKIQNRIKFVKISQKMSWNSQHVFNHPLVWEIATKRCFRYVILDSARLLIMTFKIFIYFLIKNFVHCVIILFDKPLSNFHWGKRELETFAAESSCHFRFVLILRFNFAPCYLRKTIVWEISWIFYEIEHGFLPKVLKLNILIRNSFSNTSNVFERKNVARKYLISWGMMRKSKQCYYWTLHFLQFKSNYFTGKN